jgi:hypothetical protein
VKIEEAGGRRLTITSVRGINDGAGNDPFDIRLSAS